MPMITNYIDIYCFIYPSFCFTSSSNLLNFPKQLLHIPNRLLQFPKKFSLPQHYFASLCQKLEHNFLIFFPFFHLWSFQTIFFQGTADQSALSSFEQVVQSTSSSSSPNIVINYCFAFSLNSSGARDASQITCLIQFLIDPSPCSKNTFLTSSATKYTPKSAS